MTSDVFHAASLRPRIPIGRAQVRTHAVRAKQRLTTALCAAAICASLLAAPTVAGAAADCAPEVQRAQDDRRELAINSRLALAADGYSLLPEEGFMELSCLERLMNGGMDIFFTPPSISRMLGMLKNAVCRTADNLYRQATAPMQRAVAGGINGRVLGLGEVIPGVNLGSVAGGVRVRSTDDGSEVSTNLSDLFSNGDRHPPAQTGWYGSGLYWD